MSTRMYERVAKGELAFGSMIMVTGPEWVEILGHAGLDVVLIDQMITAIDWRETADMVRAANRYNMTPWVRLPSYPWGRKTPYIPTAEVVRALSIGAEVVTVSLDSPEEVEATLAPVGDHHRRIYIQDTVYDQWLQGSSEDVEKETLIVPLLESLGAMKKIDEILSVKGLRAILLGMGDICALLGHAGQPEHPEIRAFVSDVVGKAKNKNVMVFTSLGARMEAESRMVAHTSWLRELGISCVLLPPPTHVVQRFYEHTLGAVRGQPAVDAHAS